MPREDAQSKARRLLAEGRVIITAAGSHHVSAIVRGDSASFYFVEYPRGGPWSCSCPALSERCSHVMAVQLCTVPIGPAILAPNVMVGAT